MVLTRVIPCLLLRARSFVKTVRFRDPVYLGDPINIVRLFNDKEVDELIILDIDAPRTHTEPDFEFLEELVSESFMPVCYGGGVRSLEAMRRLFALGIEKVALNTGAVEDPDLIRRSADVFGSQAIVVSIDVRTRWIGGRSAYINAGRTRIRQDPVALARRAEELGAGEILLTSIDREGTMSGYDIALASEVASALTIPVVACGGAATVHDLRRVTQDAGASAAAAGSLFVFQGPHKAVLINYPTADELRALFAAGG